MIKSIRFLATVIAAVIIMASQSHASLCGNPFASLEPNAAISEPNMFHPDYRVASTKEGSKQKSDIYEYDKKGRMVKYTSSGQLSTNEFTYDGDKIITDTSSYTSSRNYIYKCVYDEKGRIIKVLAPKAGTQDYTTMTTYTYNSNGKMTTSNMNNATTTFHYDKTGKLIKTTSSASPGPEYRYTYSSTGNIQTVDYLLNGTKYSTQTFTHNNKGQITETKIIPIMLIDYKPSDQGENYYLTPLPEEQKGQSQSMKLIYNKHGLLSKIDMSFVMKGKKQTETITVEWEKY